DGVTYTQIGPSGSRLKNYFNEAYGAFQNFVLVTVKNNKVQVKVITPDGRELSPDCVTLDEIKELQNIEKAISITPAGIGQSDSISVTVNNIFDMPFDTDLKWSINNDNWEIRPLLKSIGVPAKSSTTEKFYCRVKGKSIYPLPQIQLSYPYANYKKTFNYDKRMPIKLVSDCYKSKSKVTIDGRTIEKAWLNIKPVDIFGSSDGDISETDPWEIYFAYDKSNLYIAGKMTDYEPNKISAIVTQRDDDNIYQDDNINIILQPKVASDTYYQFFVNPKGAVLDRMCYSDGKSSKRDKKWNSEINVKTEISTGEMFNGWTFELALPIKQFDIIEPKTDWGFNLVRYQARTDKVSIYSVPFEHNPKTFALLKFSKK
ncbi:MAG: hypothetical protein N2748_05870, partial [candidate division WOR-3 bacterium]|nr:hypothetical protein [candidate division WOR-3 bacterium]